MFTVRRERGNGGNERRRGRPPLRRWLSVLVEPEALARADELCGHPSRGELGAEIDEQRHDRSVDRADTREVEREAATRSLRCGEDLAPDRGRVMHPEIAG